MIERLIEEHLKGFTGTRILDVGPGYSEFSRCSARVIGASSITILDNDADVLAFQAERNRLEGIRTESISALIGTDTIGALAGQFDLIHCQEVLEHLPEAEVVLAALASKLTKRGRVIVTVPTARSERIIRFINPGYMRHEQFGHVREFDGEGLRKILAQAGLVPEILIPAQPHYFLAHLWFFGTRTPLQGSTGRVSGVGFRQKVFALVLRSTSGAFAATGFRFWSRLFPRNYFAIARRGPGADTR
jgi:SAM-dependent methyltransferase